MVMIKGEKGVYCRYIKRILDIICALSVMVVFCWLYGIIAILVRSKLGNPIIFKQERPGKGEKIFVMFKFRTMTDERDKKGNLLPDDLRLTKLGRWLRVTSLDELPEAWNILKGDMSIVGPRPLLVQYLPYYSKEERKRHNVRPGLTGFAQVNGRNNLLWEERFMMDVVYVEKASFFLDVKILFQTIKKVFLHQDIAVGSEQIMEDLNIERSGLLYEDKTFNS